MRERGQPGSSAETSSAAAREHQHGPESPAEPGHPAGHDAHAGHSVAMLRDRFRNSLALMLPTLIWGHMLQSALG